MTSVRLVFAALLPFLFACAGTQPAMDTPAAVPAAAPAAATMPSPAASAHGAQAHHAFGSAALAGEVP